MLLKTKYYHHYDYSFPACIASNENADLVKKHRIMPWDKSKRKYVQTTLRRSELSGDLKSKKLCFESGEFYQIGQD